MGKIQKPLKVKLFAGLIAGSENKIAEAEKLLVKNFGAIDFESPVIPFTFTDYYSKEMGANLLRKWVGFEKQASPEELSKTKVKTNTLEERVSKRGPREVNIDPGYITLSKVVLASTKDFSHRIYLSQGIYAEITLLFKQKEFVSLPWTYPDYKSETALKFFLGIRVILHKKAGGS